MNIALGSLHIQFYRDLIIFIDCKVDFYIKDDMDLRGGVRTGTKMDM